MYYFPEFNAEEACFHFYRVACVEGKEEYVESYCVRHQLKNISANLYQTKLFPIDDRYTLACLYLNDDHRSPKTFYDKLLLIDAEKRTIDELREDADSLDTMRRVNTIHIERIARKVVIICVTGIITNREKRIIWEGQCYAQQFQDYEDETQSWIVYEKEAFISAIQNKETLSHPIVELVDKQGTIRYVGATDKKLFLEKADFTTGQQKLLGFDVDMHTKTVIYRTYEHFKNAEIYNGNQIILKSLENNRITLEAVEDPLWTKDWWGNHIIFANDEIVISEGEEILSGAAVTITKIYDVESSEELFRFENRTLIYEPYHQLCLLL